MKFLKLNLSWLFYLDVTVFRMLWKRLGTKRRNWRFVCHHILFWSEMGQLTRLECCQASMGSPGRTGWDGEGCTVVWGFLFWECHGDCWSFSFWGNEESVERCSSRSAWVMLADCLSGWVGNSGYCLSWIPQGSASVASNILINKVMEVQTGQMDSEIEWKLDELPGSGSCDQQHKALLGTNHQPCDTGVKLDFQYSAAKWTLMDDGTENTLRGL